MVTVRVRLREMAGGMCARAEAIACTGIRRSPARSRLRATWATTSPSEHGAA